MNVLTSRGRLLESLKQQTEIIEESFVSTTNLNKTNGPKLISGLLNYKNQIANHGE